MLSNALGVPTRCETTAGTSTSGILNNPVECRKVRGTRTGPPIARWAEELMSCLGGSLLLYREWAHQA